MTARIPDALRTYIEARILPRYDGFDAAHRRDHAQTVICQSPETAAACCRGHVEMVIRQSLAISCGRVRRMDAATHPRRPCKSPYYR